MLYIPSKYRTSSTIVTASIQRDRIIAPNKYHTCNAIMTYCLSKKPVICYTNPPTNRKIPSRLHCMKAGESRRTKEGTTLTMQQPAKIGRSNPPRRRFQVNSTRQTAFRGSSTLLLPRPHVGGVYQPISRLLLSAAAIQDSVPETRVRYYRSTCNFAPVVTAQYENRPAAQAVPIDFATRRRRRRRLA